MTVTLPTPVPFPNAESADEALVNAKHCMTQAGLVGYINHEQVWIDKAKGWAQIALAMPMAETVAVSNNDRVLTIMRAIVAMVLADSDHGGIFVITDRDLAVWSNRQMIVHEDTPMGLIRVRLDEP